MISLYVLGAVLILLLVGVILAPLLEPEPPDVDLEELPPGGRYQGALEALREVEFEYQTEKLPADEYERLRARYGRIALEAEEALSEEEVEAARQAARSEAPAPAGRDGGPRSRAEIRACGECGEMIPVTARFCPRCGQGQESRPAGGSG